MRAYELSRRVNSATGAANPIAVITTSDTVLVALQEFVESDLVMAAISGDPALRIPSVLRYVRVFLSAIAPDAHVIF